MRGLKDWTSCGYAAHRWPSVEHYIGLKDWVAHANMRNFVEWAGDKKSSKLLSGHDLNAVTAGGKASLMWSVLQSAL